MTKATILIVEDEALIAEDLARKLTRIGHEVAATASEGEEAVELARELRPDLVLMDIVLDGPMDGIAAAHRIQRRQDIPVVYLTAHSDSATLQRAKVTGPFGYILKPFEDRDLATQIELALYKHQAERQLREQREWLRVTLSSIGDAIIATDADGSITFLNPVAESLTGWRRDEAIGKPVPEVFRVINEATREAVDDPVRKVLQSGKIVGLANHTILLRKGGSEIPVDDSGAPIVGTDGNILGVVMVFRDITERRQHERNLLQALKGLEETNQELNENSYAVTHNLKAPLRAVQNYTHFLFEDLGDKLQGEPKQLLEGIRKAAKEGHDQLADLETLYRIRNHAVSNETFSLEELFDEMHSLFQGGPGRELVTEGAYPQFRGERLLLRQLLIELIRNGFKFNRSEIKRVEVGCRPTTDRKGVAISVRDNGIGIAPQYHEQIFRLFQRLHTDSEYKGTGVGLAIVKKAVQKMEGALRLESAVGKGSTFIVSLPAANHD